jgi:tight adherence protein B
MTRRVILATLAAVALALGLVAPAASQDAAASTGRISSVSSTQGEVTLSFTGVNLPAGTSIDAESVQVTLDGEPVEATVEPITEAAEVPDRTVVLTMDTSGSMAEDDKIGAARTSALDFLGRLPPEVNVGLISFADTAQVLVAPTTDRGPVSDAINGLVAEGDTALYDAVVLASQTVGTDGIRSSIILSDGEDTVSTETIEAATTAAGGSGAQFDAIALGQGAAEAVADLERIAVATGGAVVQAGDAAELAEVFDVAAEVFTNELVITAAVPDGFEAREATLEVTASADGQQITDSAFVRVLPATPAPTASPTPTVPASEEFGPIAAPPSVSAFSQGFFVVGLIAAAIGLAAILWYAFGGRRDEKAEVRSRLAVYSLGGSTPKKQEEVVTTVLGDTAAMRSAVGVADKFVKRRDYESLLALRLDSAGLPLRPAEWTLIHFGLTIGLGVLLAVVFNFNLLAGLAGVAIGVLGPFAYLSNKASRRRTAFQDQLADTLQVMAGSMSAGYSLPQAVDTVVREDIDPISTEFNRALVESRLGAPIEDALDGVALRMQSDDFSWVVMAIRIQRQVGGNLAELLTTVARLIRERARLRRQVRVLSAEGRLSAWILLALPFVVAFFVLLRNPGYLNPLFTDPIGWVMLIGSAVFMLAGVLWIRKIIDVEV